MVYVKKTTSTLKLVYTLVAGVLLLVWVLLFGASDNGSNSALTSWPKAYADAPNCNSCNSCSNCNSCNDAGNDSDGGCGNCTGDSVSCCDCDMNF